MAIDPAESQVTLLDAARVLARGRDLDSKLRALAGHARAMAGGSSALILLYDSDAAQLLSADGSHWFDAASPDDALTRAVRDRHVVNDEIAARPDLVELAPGASRTLVPMIVEDESGTAVEGLLVVGSGSGAPPEAATIERLSALADLAAVAIRQARLHNALLEQCRVPGAAGAYGSADGARKSPHVRAHAGVGAGPRRPTGFRAQRAGLCVDGLSEINAEQGGGARDDVLRRVAATLADQVRLIDTVARIGDGEFGVIASGDSGMVVARRVRDAVAALEPIGGLPISVTGGVSQHPRDGTTSSELLAAADRAMSAARDRGPGSLSSTAEPGDAGRA